MSDEQAGVAASGSLEAREISRRFRTFLIVWFGQLISLVGSGLTWFGFSVWVFLEAGSVTDLSLMLLASQLPRILLSPIAGAFVDRWDRRWAMIISDGAAGVGTVVIAVAFLTDSISLGLLIVVGAISSAFNAFQWPAYQAATTMLVPKERYSRASGMVQMAEVSGQLVHRSLEGSSSLSVVLRHCWRWMPSRSASRSAHCSWCGSRGRPCRRSGRRHEARCGRSHCSVSDTCGAVTACSHC